MGWKKLLSDGDISLDNLSDYKKGTDTPNTGNYTTLMPNVGDLYHKTNGTRPEIFCRTSDQIVHKLDINEWGEVVNDEPVYGNPRVNQASVIICNSSGSTLSSTNLVGSSISIYAKLAYSDVNGGIDVGIPEMKFYNNDNSATYYKDLSQSNNTLTGSSLTISNFNKRDGYVYATPRTYGNDLASASTTKVEESDGQGSNEYVDVPSSNVTDYMFFRNRILWGWVSGTSSANITSGLDAAGLSRRAYGLGAGSYIDAFTNGNTTRSMTVPSGNYWFVAYPEDGEGTINTIDMEANGQPVFGNAENDTTQYTQNWENTSGFTEEYRIYINNNIYSSETEVKFNEITS